MTRKLYFDCLEIRPKISNFKSQISLSIATIEALAFVMCLYYWSLPVEAVDCFKCSSRNGSNPACEDPFHNLNTTRVTSMVMPEVSSPVVYQTPCYSGRKGRQGLFPASACIKVTGVFDTTGETLVVRHCALDSGTLTQDTEIARMSHCGKFHFSGDYLKGCVLSCVHDGCNSAPSSNQYLATSNLVLITIASLLATSTYAFTFADTFVKTSTLLPLTFISSFCVLLKHVT